MSTGCEVTLAESGQATHSLGSESESSCRDQLQKDLDRARRESTDERSETDEE